MKELEFKLIPVERIEGYRFDVLENKWVKVDETEIKHKEKLFKKDNNDKLSINKPHTHIIYNTPDKANYIQDIYKRFKKDADKK